jgi:hypothetical protein
VIHPFQIRLTHPTHMGWFNPPKYSTGKAQATAGHVFKIIKSVIPV